MFHFKIVIYHIIVTEMTDETWILCNTSQKDFPPEFVSDGGEGEYWGLKDIFICEKFFQTEDFKSGQPYSEAGCDHFGLDFSCCDPCAAYLVTQTWLQNMWKETKGRCI